MKIELHEITVSELTEGYCDNEEKGVTGYGGRLDIRPPYQREFIYDDKKRNAVIDTIINGFPLNVMYWAARDDGSYEVIDGQQRTISICRYVTNVFSFDFRKFCNLEDDEKERILEYRLMVYVCSGSDSEKLRWFETINIAGEQLTRQELLNATYYGSWLADAKRYFSRRKCAAISIADDYVSGSPIRQELLETALNWISDGSIRVYMMNHQHDQNANALWRYFQDVITWIEGTFTVKRKKFMKGVNWGKLYGKYKDLIFDTDKLEAETARLILDDDVTKKSGIYPYLLTGDERHLSIRAFSDSIKQSVYERQKGVCPLCGQHFEPEQMEADHITPWSAGGTTTADNCQMLCRDCNRRKSNR